MAEEVKISALPDAGDVQTGDTVLLVRAGVTSRSTQDPSISSSSMVGQAGQGIVVNGTEDGFDFTGFPADTQQISFTWNGSGNTTAGSNLMVGELDEVLLAYSVDLVAMSILRSDTDAATLEVLVDGTPVHELASSALNVIEIPTPVAISASSRVAVRNKAGGNTVSNCGVTLTFVRT